MSQFIAQLQRRLEEMKIGVLRVEETEDFLHAQGLRLLAVLLRRPFSLSRLVDFRLHMLTTLHYAQQVSHLGEFSEAFNVMTRQLKEREAPAAVLAVPFG